MTDAFINTIRVGGQCYFILVEMYLTGSAFDLDLDMSFLVCQVLLYEKNSIKFCIMSSI